MFPCGFEYDPDRIHHVLEFGFNLLLNVGFDMTTNRGLESEFSSNVLFFQKLQFSQNLWNVPLFKNAPPSKKKSKVPVSPNLGEVEFQKKKTTRSGNQNQENVGVKTQSRVKPMSKYSRNGLCSKLNHRPCTALSFDTTAIRFEYDVGENSI